MRHQLQTFSLRLKALGEESGRRGPGVDREAVGWPWKRRKSAMSCTWRLRLPIQVIWAPKTPSMSAPLKGCRRIYQQTFLDTYAKVAFAKLYTMKTPLTAVDLLNDQMLPFFEQHAMGLLRVLTDRGTEYSDSHDYELYLAINNIDHSKTKAKHPQTNGICERFHKTMLQEFYQVAFRKKIYRTLDLLQKDLNEWLDHYNHERTHQGKNVLWAYPHADVP